MAKETKAERQAREAVTREAMREEQATQYLPKLMRVLQEATQLNDYELTVRDNLFALRDRNSRYNSLVTLSPVYSEPNWDALQALEWDLEVKAEARAELERKQSMKQVALAKLTKEEKELLNLS
jgi:hypothetical protein